MVSVWSTDCDLISHLKAVKIRGQLTTFLNTEFLILFICRRGSNGKHTFAYTRSTNHGTLSRHMFKKLSSIRCCYTECFYIRSLLMNICDHANLRDQSIQSIIFMTGTLAHYFSPPCFSKALITFTIFKDDGHFSTQRPQPTQEYIPLLLAGKYTSLCINL